MDFLEFEKLVKERQSCRDFNELPLEREKVEKIVDLARNAPSACNSQPWKMYVATTPEKVSEVIAPLMDGNRNTFLKKAKAVIVVTEKEADNLKEDVKKRFSLDYFVKYDVGELIAYLTLGAKAIGVESIIIGWINLENLLKTVGAEKGEKVALAVALGYSDAPLREKVRKPKEKTVKFLD